MGDVKDEIWRLPPAESRGLFSDPSTVGPLLRLFLWAIATALRRVSPGQLVVDCFETMHFIYLFGASLNPNPHVHCLITDGAFSSAMNREAIFHKTVELGEIDILRVRAWCDGEYWSG